MPTKKINLAYEGESELIDAAVDALAASNGCPEGTPEEKQVAATNLVNQFIRGVVTNYNVRKLQAQIEDQVRFDLEVSLDLITKSFSVQEESTQLEVPVEVETPIVEELVFD